MASLAKTRLLLVRHGDRFDFAQKEQWQDICAEHGHPISDPPLSALGHTQARETAAELERRGVELILCSPYTRTIQTAAPLADACSLRICVEPGLAEFHHVPRINPAPAARTAYFPSVDPSYCPLFQASGRAACTAARRPGMPLAVPLQRRASCRRHVAACRSKSSAVRLTSSICAAPDLLI